MWNFHINFFSGEFRLTLSFLSNVAKGFYKMAHLLQHGRTNASNTIMSGLDFWKMIAFQSIMFYLGKHNLCALMLLSALCLFVQKTAGLKVVHFKTMETRKYFAGIMIFLKWALDNKRMDRYGRELADSGICISKSLSKFLLTYRTQEFRYTRFFFFFVKCFVMCDNGMMW